MLTPKAHCISEWGHAFRPTYLLLKRKANELSVKRFLCCTATATKLVSDDIMDAFKIPKRNLVRTLFHRKNLHLDAIVVKDDTERLSQIVKCLKIDLAGKSVYRGSGIIYVTTQKTTNQIKEYLALSGIECRSYHAGMTVADRNSTQEWYLID
jgi:ATP-dependent DNA helicase RecQ